MCKVENSSPSHTQCVQKALWEVMVLEPLNTLTSVEEGGTLQGKKRELKSSGDALHTVWCMQALVMATARRQHHWEPTLRASCVAS